jgi:hypothetical protein
MKSRTAMAVLLLALVGGAAAGDRRLAAGVTDTMKGRLMPAYRFSDGHDFSFH